MRPFSEITCVLRAGKKEATVRHNFEHTFLKRKNETSTCQITHQVGSHVLVFTRPDNHHKWDILGGRNSGISHKHFVAPNAAAQVSSASAGGEETHSRFCSNK